MPYISSKKLGDFTIKGTQIWVNNNDNNIFNKFSFTTSIRNITYYFIKTGYMESTDTYIFQAVRSLGNNGEYLDFNAYGHSLTEANIPVSAETVGETEILQNNETIIQKLTNILLKKYDSIHNLKRNESIETSKEAQLKEAKKAIDNTIEAKGININKEEVKETTDQIC